MNTVQRRWLLLCALLFISIGLVRYLNNYNYLTLDALKAHSSYYQGFVDRHYFVTVLLYCSIYASLIAVGVPATPLMTLLGGFLFGAFPGFIYALTSAVVGVVTTFLVIRYFLAKLLSVKYQKQLDQFQEKIKQYGYTYLLSLHLLMVIPYFIITTLAALAEVPLFTFAWTALIGSAPLLAVYSYAGRHLGSIESIKDVVSPGIMAILVMLGLLALLPIIIKWFYKKHTV